MRFLSFNIGIILGFITRRSGVQISFSLPVIMRVSEVSETRFFI